MYNNQNVAAWLIVILQIGGVMMIKRIFVILTVLSITGVANATLKIVTQDDVMIGQPFNIGIHSQAEPALLTGLIAFQGPLSVDISEMTIIDLPGISHPPYIVDLSDDPLIPADLADMGIDNFVKVLYYEIVDVAVPPMTIPDGMIIDNISVTCNEACFFCGTIFLIDAAAGQIIATTSTCIPEPATLLLLTIGGLFIHRRR